MNFGLVTSWIFTKYTCSAADRCAAYFNTGEHAGYKNVVCIKRWVRNMEYSIHWPLLQGRNIFHPDMMGTFTHIYPCIQHVIFKTEKYCVYCCACPNPSHPILAYHTPSHSRYF